MVSSNTGLYYKVKYNVYPVVGPITHHQTFITLSTPHSVTQKVESLPRSGLGELVDSV